MRKTIAAIAVGIIVVAGQAQAAGSKAALTRAGGSPDCSDEFAGVPTAVLLNGGAVVATAMLLATDDDAGIN